MVLCVVSLVRIVKMLKPTIVNMTSVGVNGDSSGVDVNKNVEVGLKDIQAGKFDYNTVN